MTSRNPPATDPGEQGRNPHDERTEAEQRPAPQGLLRFYPALPHGSHRRHPARLSGRQERRCHGDQDADGVRDDCGTWLEDQPVGGDVGTEQTEHGLEPDG